MKQEQINYQDLIDLKFKRGDMSDAVHQKQYGYDDFWVRLKLSKRYYIDWENKTRFAEIQVMEKDKEGRIDDRFPIQNLEELKKYMRVFGKLPENEKEKQNIVWSETSNNTSAITSAC